MIAFALDKTVSNKKLTPILTNCFGVFILEDAPAAKTKIAIFINVYVCIFPSNFLKEKGSFALITARISAIIETPISSGVCAPICNPAGV